jgi:hypothetical protein
MNQLSELEIVCGDRRVVQVRNDQVCLRRVNVGLDLPHRSAVNTTTT